MPDARRQSVDQGQRTKFAVAQRVAADQQALNRCACDGVFLAQAGQARVGGLAQFSCRARIGFGLARIAGTGHENLTRLGLRSIGLFPAQIEQQPLGGP